MERDELILYATPTGQLAERCATYFRLAQGIGATTAQTYPPHCSLTGFFRRPPGEAPRVVAELVEVLAAAGLEPDGRIPAEDVRVHPLHVTDEWLGLELDAPRLTELASAFARRHRHEPGRGDDPIRLKSWLHLSLAYGRLLADTGVGSEAPQPLDLERYRLAADRLGLGTLQSDWEVALWQRHPTDRWSRLVTTG